MYYSLSLSELPLIKRFYSVTRTTVWQIAEREHLLIYIKKGRCAVSANGTEYILEEGDVFYIPAETAYVRRPIDNIECSMVYIHFTTSSRAAQEEPEDLVRALDRLKLKLDTEILSGENDISLPNTICLQSKSTIADRERFEELLSGINLYSENRMFLCGLQSSISLCGILLILSQNALDTLLTDTGIRDSRPVPVKLKRALGYIARNYSAPISLNDLAAYCSVSRQQMIRYFRAALNTTPLQYITEYKMSRAKEMLFNHPQLTIKEIASELGYDNQHYFSRVFIRTCGETPSHYRYRTINYSKIARQAHPQPRP